MKFIIHGIAPVFFGYIPKNMGEKRKYRWDVKKRSHTHTPTVNQSEAEEQNTENKNRIVHDMAMTTQPKNDKQQFMGIMEKGNISWILLCWHSKFYL